MDETGFRDKRVRASQGTKLADMQDTLLPSSLGQAGQQLLNNLGAAARGVTSGVAGPVTMLADPLTDVLNKILPPGWQQQHPSQGLATLYDVLGVPRATTPAMQVLEGSTSGLGAGGAVAGTARALTPMAEGLIKKYLDVVGGNVGNQMLSGMTSGAAGTGAYNGALAAGLSPDQAQLAGLGAGVLGGAAPVGSAASRVAKMGQAADVIESVAKTGKAPKAKVGGEVAKSLGYDPIKLGQQYPDTALPEWTLYNNTKYIKPGRGKEGPVFVGPEDLRAGWGKVSTPEQDALQEARNAAQQRINNGEYDPLFNIQDRYHIPEGTYQRTGDTLVDSLAKKQPTIDKWTQMFDTPEIRQRLHDAYMKASNDPNAKNWYAMGQLYDAFKNELGPVEGAKMFKERFADAMAATTGGADPTANLLTAAYGNYMKTKGLPLPTTGANAPHPIGGQYAGGNLAMYDKVMNQGVPMTAADQPKRFNFSGNFLGDLNHSTIDEQMSGIYKPGMTRPPDGAYGVMERVANEIAASMGLKPANFQDVAWAGQKGVPGKPMMQHVNEAIARTAMVTGKTPQEVLKGFIRGTNPLYALGVIPAGGALLSAMGAQDGRDPSASPGGY